MVICQARRNKNAVPGLGRHQTKIRTKNHLKGNPQMTRRTQRKQKNSPVESKTGLNRFAESELNAMQLHDFLIATVEDCADMIGPHD